MDRREADKPYILRPYKESDINFIQSSWGNSYYQGTSANLFRTPEEFHAYHRPIRENLFKKPTCTIIVAVSKDDPDLIIGWVAIEKIETRPELLLHYIYVKQAFKNEGIATNLVQALNPETVLYTHRTEKSQKILAKKYDQIENSWYFTPHLIS